MLRLRRNQRAVLADKLADLENLFAGGFVIGPFLSQRPVSVWLVVIGLGTWAGVTALSLAITEETS